MFPDKYSLASKYLGFWHIFIPALMGLPIMYATYYVLFDIYTHSLLPARGRRSILAIFHFRLVMVYFVMWVPCLLVIAIGNFVEIPTWIA